MDTIDKILRDYMTNKAAAGASRDVFEPSEGMWHRFFDNTLTDDEEGAMSAYLLKHEEAREFALKTRKILAESERVSYAQAPKEWVAAAKKRATITSAKPKKKNVFMIWYAISAIAFGLSFLIPRHYMQFLVVTVLAGIKAIVDQRQAKMQIMIYQALESGNEINSDRLKKMGIKP